MDQPSATVANGGEEEEPSAPPRGPSAHLRDTLLTTQRKMEGLVAAHERATAAHARTSASWPAVGNAVGAAARGIPRQGASYALTAPVAAAAAAASSSSAPLSGGGGFATLVAAAAAAPAAGASAASRTGGLAIVPAAPGARAPMSSGSSSGEYEDAVGGSEFTIMASRRRRKFGLPSSEEEVYDNPVHSAAADGRMNSFLRKGSIAQLQQAAAATGSNDLPSSTGLIDLRGRGTVQLGGQYGSFDFGTMPPPRSGHSTGATGAPHLLGGAPYALPLRAVSSSSASSSYLSRASSTGSASSAPGAAPWGNPYPSDLGLGVSLRPMQPLQPAHHMQQRMQQMHRLQSQFQPQHLQSQHGGGGGHRGGLLRRKHDRNRNSPPLAGGITDPEAVWTAENLDRIAQRAAEDEAEEMLALGGGGSQYRAGESGRRKKSDPRGPAPRSVDTHGRAYTLRRRGSGLGQHACIGYAIALATYVLRERKRKWTKEERAGYVF